MVVVFHVGYYKEPWTATDMDRTGLGGSEKCVALIADQFSKSGNDVYVVGDVHENNRGDNPRYLAFSSVAEVPQEIDLLVGVNYIHYLVVYQNHEVKKNAFWIHNTEFYPWYRGVELDPNVYHLNSYKIDHVICLTGWHKETIANRFNVDPKRIHVIGNPVNVEAFVPYRHEDKIKHSFIYTSHAERGLTNVIEEWPSILETLPDATLHIATPMYGMDYFNDYYLHRVLQMPNTIFYGSLGQKELYNLMAACEVWYYPSDYEETFCLTAIEMLGHGVIPVTRMRASLQNVLKGKNINTWTEAIQIAEKWRTKEKM